MEPTGEINRNTHFAITILRWGLAFVLIYSAFAGLFYERIALIYFPHELILSTQGNPGLLLTGTALFELALAAWLFWGKRLELAAAVTFAALVLTLIVNAFHFDLVFENVGLALSALALWALVRRPV